MKIINNTNGLYEDIYFNDDILNQSIKNHKELIETIIQKCSKVLIASPFLMKDFEPFFKNINIENIEFELITTYNPKGDEQLTKPFQLKNFGLTIKELTSRWTTIHLLGSLHSKIYLFYKDNSIVLGIVTSANFTNSGLVLNHETGVVLSDNTILKSLEVDLRNNLEYINLSESQINKLCKEADLKKKNVIPKTQEDIDINISKYLERNNTQSLEEAQNLNDNDVFIDKNKEFIFEDFISHQVLHNNKIDVIDLSNLNINIIPSSINKLKELKNINISNNNITILPDELFSLKKLEVLDISENNIKFISDKIQELKYYPKVFHKLALYGNEDIKIHIDITWVKSLEIIIVDKSIINKTLLIFKQFKDANVQIIDKHNKDLYEYIEYCDNEILNDKTDTLYMKYNQNIVKTCTRCDTELGLDRFYNSDKHSGKNNYYPHCKDCDSQEGKDKERQADYIIRRLYNKKLLQQVNKNNLPIPYTKEEFVELIENQPLFKELYEEYKYNDYIAELKPNYYLIDKQTDYTLENIQICTSKEANEKYQKINIGGKTTIQFTLCEEPIQVFESTQEVTRQIGIADSGVCNSCNYNKKAGGYNFKYLENIKDTSILDKLKKIEKVNLCYVDDEDFLLDFVDNKDLEDYLKVILYFKKYEDQGIKDTLLSNTSGYLLEIFKKDSVKLIEEFNSNFSKIEVEYFEYLYGFVNIRYKENENISILEILKIIAKNTKSKQLIEFLMENKTKEEIFISIIENNNFVTDIEFLEKRIIKYYLKSNYIELANKILQIQELKTNVIKKVIAKVGEEEVKDTLLSMTYLQSSTNKWVSDNYGCKKIENLNIEKLKENHISSKKNDKELIKLLIEFRDNDIFSEFNINEKCILSSRMIEQLIIYKPLDKKEFLQIPKKFRENIDSNQMKFIDDIFKIIDLAT